MLRKGNFVKVIDGINLGSNLKTQNWMGEIREIYSKFKTCLIALDSITLDSLAPINTY